VKNAPYIIIVQHKEAISVALHLEPLERKVIDWKSSHMNVDAITLAAVADEWRTLLTGARIDTIIQPTEHAIALQCYAPGFQGDGSGHNRWLYLSAHPQLARAHLTALKPSRIASEPPAFVMLLRKYLEGARIETIAQPRWERVLELIASHRSGPDSDQRTRYRLIIEIMGRLSNIIFCDEHGLILGSLKHIGSNVNRYRTIAANVPYVPPPPQQRTFAGQTQPKLEPSTLNAAQLELAAGDEISIEQSPASEKARKRPPEQPKLWQLLTRHLLGFSPLLAREAVYRTTGNAEYGVDEVRRGGVDEVRRGPIYRAQDSLDGDNQLLADSKEEIWEELAWNVRELASLYDNHHWQPQLVERVGEDQPAPATSPLPIAFAPYVLEQYAQVPGVRIRQSPSINVLLDDYYARTEWRDAMESVRTPIRKILQTQRDRCKRKAGLLQQELASSAEAAHYRLQAELLLAHQHEVSRGQASVTLRNFFEDETGDQQSNVIISLDPRFDAVGNANRLFNKYDRLRRATALVPAQIEQNATELATIEQLLADLMLADTPAEVALVKAEVQTAGYMRGAPKAQEKKAQKSAKKGKGGRQAKAVPPGGGLPLRVQSRDGFAILIGKNSRQNEEVTFHQAAANDIWLHARGVPGAHVIIKAAGREISRTTIEQAASLAAYYSQARGTTTAPVDYTLQRHVKHMKGGGPGMVIYERERTIYVAPESFQHS
jgi:predicted ribosome quality control (RQC) complex YloA/Tae2 family protein